jgi:hypothetical protein
MQQKLKIKLVMKIFLTVRLYTISTCALGAGSQLDHEELLKTRPARTTVWSFDASTIHNQFTAPDGSEFAGTGASFTAGYGRIRQNAWILGRFHFLAGPWDTARNGAFDADFYGSGLDVEYGTAFPGTELRSGSTPILTVAAGYMDLSGRNIGGNRKTTGNPEDRDNYYLEQDFKAGFGTVYLMPGAGWSWTKPARPTGNEPELLVTRVESAYMKLSATIPVYSRARVEVTKRSSTDSLNQSPRLHSTSGMIRGYSLVLATGVWLGI